MPGPGPIPAAERQRRHRVRRKHGRFVVPVELAEEHLNMLTVGGWLNDGDAGNPRACGAAIGHILDRLSKKVSRVTSASDEPC